MLGFVLLIKHSKAWVMFLRGGEGIVKVAIDAIKELNEITKRDFLCDPPTF